MTFRWFADVETGGIIIKVQKNQKEPPQILKIKIGQESTKIKKITKDAFEIIN